MWNAALFSHVPHLRIQPMANGRMSLEQRASQEAGGLIDHAYESLLEVNLDLERLQSLGAIGLDLKELLAPHSPTVKFLAPQVEHLRENWGRLIRALESADSRSVGTGPRQEVIEAGQAETAPASLPAITVRAPGQASPAIQITVRCLKWFY